MLVASETAVQAGLRIGMKRSGASALCPAAVLHERDARRERAALEGIAFCLLQYTPEVALAEEQGLLLDITASLRAFGGLRPLFRRARASILDLGFSVQISLAPSAQGAWLLARAMPGTRRPHRRALRLTTLARRLDRLPCALLPSLFPFREWLDGIGCRTLGDLRKLPRAGLRRRCNQEVLSELDRAYGEAPELFDWIQAPEIFSARLDLPDRVEHAEALLFGARRLLLQMTGWLAARQRAVRRFALALEHERGRQALSPTVLELALAEAAWQEAHLTSLLKERLQRIALDAPVIGLRLEASDTEAMEPPSGMLFPEPGGTPADYARLLELLTARLGDEGVLVPAPRADHRPEICNRWLPASAASAALPALPANLRPFWILASPLELPVRDHRPFYGSPLRLVSPPERIECGWWDGNLVMRDYFVAQGSEPALYWVYRERLGEDVRWYLHGLFA